MSLTCVLALHSGKHRVYAQTLDYCRDLFNAGLRVRAASAGVEDNERRVLSQRWSLTRSMPDWRRTNQYLRL